MNSILVAALGGAFGAGLGALLGYAIDRVTNGRFKAATYGPIAGVIAAVSVTSTMNSGGSVESQVDKIAPFKVMHQYYPTEYQKVLTVLRGAQSSRDPVAIQNAARPIYSALLMRQAPSADDANAYEMARLVRDETASMRQVSADACVTFATGSGVLNVYVRKVFTPDEVKRDLALGARLLEQTAKAPLPAPPRLSDETLRGLSQASFNRLSAADRAAGESMFQQNRPPLSQAEKLAYCDFQVALMDELVAKPANQAGPMFRSLLVTR